MCAFNQVLLVWCCTTDRFWLCIFKRRACQKEKKLSKNWNPTLKNKKSSGRPKSNFTSSAMLHFTIRINTSDWWLEAVTFPCLDWVLLWLWLKNRSMNVMNLQRATNYKHPIGQMRNSTCFSMCINFGKQFFFNVCENLFLQCSLSFPRGSRSSL